MLTEFLMPHLKTLQINDVWFQQNEASPHYSLMVRRYLDETFSNHWIGRGGPVEWPPRSPDLTPLDFFLWGYLKFRVYRNNPKSTDELKSAIVYECRKITPQTLLKVLSNCIRRMLICKQNSGRHFKHLL